MRTNYSDYTYDSFSHNPATYKNDYSDYYKHKGLLTLLVDKGIQHYDIDAIQDQVYESYSQHKLTESQYRTLMQLVLDIEEKNSICNAKMTKNVNRSLQR